LGFVIGYIRNPDGHQDSTAHKSKSHKSVS
jgi:hypothetical protein